MDSTSVRLEVMSPRGEPPALAPITPVVPVRAWRGKRLGILNNTRAGGVALLPFLLAGLRQRLPDVPIRTWEVPFPLDAEAKAPLLARIAAESDAVIALTGEGGNPTAKTARDVAGIERLGRPAVFLVVQGFAASARNNAAAAGLPRLNVVELAHAVVPPRAEIERLKLGEWAAEALLAALRTGAPEAAASATASDALPVFQGADYSEAMERMEQFFLRHRWSDGLPLVPPRRDAVERMLAGTELPPAHVVGLIEPLGAAATVERIAVNAVLAGCRPHHLPLLIAAVEALADPRFDLQGVACTAGPAAPLLVVSGPAAIDAMNLNTGFGAMGPGWRANATIGRALRLIMINLGGCWPGDTDLKSFGSPFMNVHVLAEREAAYPPHWEPLRVAEGFGAHETTVSVLAAMTWQVDIVQPESATTGSLRELIVRQARAKYDRLPENWGADNLVILSPYAFAPLRRDGISRRAFQELIHGAASLPAREFFTHKAAGPNSGGIPLPQELLERAQGDPAAPVPLLRAPESLKVVAAGAPGPAIFAYVSTWGWGRSYFVTKAVALPRAFERLREGEREWETPAAGGGA
ncbi:MAG: hypothetical protein HY423_00110 [Candidatus Lambdaproteobacteria bacterium]|nr:hypothetical protein [Candidatus Lambdaproteobacteria bacterium]